MHIIEAIKKDWDRLEDLFENRRKAIAAKADANLAWIDEEIRTLTQGTIGKLTHHVEDMGRRIDALEKAAGITPDPVAPDLNDEDLPAAAAAKVEQTTQQAAGSGAA